MRLQAVTASREGLHGGEAVGGQAVSVRPVVLPKSGRHRSEQVFTLRGEVAVKRLDRSRHILGVQHVVEVVGSISGTSR